MAVAEVRVQTEAEVLPQLERIAARQNRSAADLLRGIAGPLPDRPDRDLIAGARSDGSAKPK